MNGRGFIRTCALPCAIFLAFAMSTVAADGPAGATTAARRPATLAPDVPYEAPASPSLPSPQGCGDAFDPGNQTCNAPDPPLIGPGVYPGLQSEPFFPSFDEDFYRIFVGTGQRLSVTITFSHAIGDATMAIYSPACAFLVNSATTNDAEHCEFTNGGPPAEYRIVVDSNGPSCVTYTMSITLDCVDGYDPNESCGGALVQLGPGTYPNLWANDFIGTGDADWYRVRLRRSEVITARAIYAVAPADAEIGLLTDDCVNLLALERSGGNLVHSISYVHDGPDADFRLATGHYDPATCHAYDLEIMIGGSGNLDNTVIYPGWSNAVVPTNVPGAPVLTPTLDGNAPTTFLNWTIRQTGPFSMPQWDTEASIDGVGTGVFAPGDPAVPLDYFAADHGAFTVRGGRHTISSVTDRFDLIHETNESDNSYAVQHVWSPLVTAFEMPNVRNVPPDVGISLPNSDGFEFTRDPSYAWVVSLAARGTFDDYDLPVYDDYSGSTAGFSNQIGGSGAFLNETDFVVGHYSGTPVTVRPAAILFNPGSGGTDFAMDQSDARFRNGDVSFGPVNWLSQSLPANRLADVYEAFMVVGNTYYFSLRRTSGPSDLLFTIYSGTAGGVYGRFADVPSTPLSPDTDVLTHFATVTGWHPVVVYRHDGSAADQPMTYDFFWSQTGYVDAGTNPSPTGEFAFLGAWPNPISGSARFEFSLPRAGQASVALYDAGGRLVRNIAERAFDAGRQSVAFDGNADDGGRLAAGVYWAMLEFEDRVLTRRVVRL